MCFHSCQKADSLEEEKEEEGGNRGRGDDESRTVRRRGKKICHLLSAYYVPDT